ncbi:MAG: nucleoside kinase [Candidatus Mcinerneyibacterium aminivorans]|uniref:Nucleoside kinase n=1 Tax=Candidatus Mcinerneyibacterium aminivorans TaxID=2703815 RepID=A0A5D0MJL2_9BACT|nr:MAG: nucleoside kinase [Candidatus Mcinerneyibacterium aminivorans]
MSEDLNKIFIDKNNVAIKAEGKIYSKYEIDKNLIQDMDYEVIKLNEKEGYRIYEKSLIMLLAAAIKKIYPDSKFSVEHTLSHGIYCKFESNQAKILKISHINEIKQKMKKLVEEDIDFKIIEKGNKELYRLLKKNNLEKKAEILKKKNLNKLIKLTDEVYELPYYNTVPSTGYLNIFNLLYYPPGFILKLPDRANMKKIAFFKESKKLFRIHQEYEKWTDIIDIKYAPSLNEKIDQNLHKEMILISEKMHEKKIVDISDNILENLDRSRLLLVSGPSASGKTTFSKRLAIHLKAAGLKPITIEMDDYFFPRKQTPIDENGNKDFESIKAIDISKFNEDILRMLEGEEVTLPEYDFVSGVRKKGKTIKIGHNDPIIIEGIHSLHPSLTKFIPDNIKFKIYVSALTPLNLDRYNRIHTSDVRLIRRIVRDAQFRGHSADETLKMWTDVQKGENKYIFPFQERADVMFNSALPYEISVLKDFCKRFLIHVKEDSIYYAEARKLLNILELFNSIDPYYVPKSSILREFIGNSIFDY